MIGGEDTDENEKKNNNTTEARHESQAKGRKGKGV